MEIRVIDIDGKEWEGAINLQPRRKETFDIWIGEWLFKRGVRTLKKCLSELQAYGYQVFFSSRQKDVTIIEPTRVGELVDPSGSEPEDIGGSNPSSGACEPHWFVKVLDELMSTQWLECKYCHEKLQEEPIIRTPSPATWQIYTQPFTTSTGGWTINTWQGQTYNYN